MMQANAGMMSDFADLHDQVKVLGERGHLPQAADPSDKADKQRRGTVKFTDLKQERQLRSQHATWALKSSDYREKAEEIDCRDEE